MKKQIMILLLFIVLIFGTTQKSYASVKRIDFTDTIYGELDDNNNLIIYGHGNLSQSVVVKKFEFLEANSILFRADSNKIAIVDADSFFGGINAKNITIDDKSNVELKVDRLNSFFSGSSIEKVDLSGLDVSNIKNMTKLFYDCKYLTEVKIPKGVANLEVISDMFSGCENLKNIDLSFIRTDKITEFDYMFYRCESLESIDLSNITTKNARSFKSMFSGCRSLKELDVSRFDTSNATNMEGMFSRCSSLISLDLSSFNTSHVKSMMAMFGNCNNLEELNLSSFDTRNVVDMTSMFIYCLKLKNVDISKFNTSKLRYMDNMFVQVPIEIMDLRGFDCSYIEKICSSGSGGQSLTYNCFDLATIIIGDDFFDEKSREFYVNVDEKIHTLVVSNNPAVKEYDWRGDNRIVTFMSIEEYEKDKPKVTLKSISAKKTKTAYSFYETFNTDDITVIAEYSDGSEKVVTNYALNNIDMTSSGNQALIISYEENGIKCAANITINVKYRWIENFEITNLKTEYYIGEQLDFDNLSIIGTLNDGTKINVNTYTTYDIHANEFSSRENKTYRDIDTSIEGVHRIQISCIELSGVGRITKPYDIIIKKPEMKSITATKDVIKYYVGEKIDINDLIVTATYINGTTLKVTNYTTNINDINTSKEGEYDLIVTYKEGSITCSFKIAIMITKNIEKDIIVITYKSFDKNGIEYVVPRNLLNMGNGTNNPEEIEIKNKKMTEALANVKVGDKISSDIVNKQNQGGQFKGEIAGGVHTNSKWTKVDKTNNHYEGVIYLTDTKLGKDSIVVTLYHKDKTTKNILDKKELNFGNSRENPERLTIKYTYLPMNYKDNVKVGDKVVSSIINDTERLGKYVTTISNNCYVDSEWTKVDSTLEEYEAVIYWTLKDNTEKAVTKLVSNTSYMNGYEDNTFKPTSNITREETAAILSRLCDNFTNYNLEDKKTDFTDVKSGSWSEKNIAYISDLGIMKGDGESFNKSSFITRGEFVTAVVRLLGLENTTVQKEFQDAKGSWYSNNANILLSLGIISGDEKGNFNGKNPITRAEICKIINNVLGKSINPNELETKKANNKLTDVNQTAWYYNDVLMATQN